MSRHLPGRGCYDRGVPFFIPDTDHGPHDEIESPASVAVLHPSAALMTIVEEILKPDGCDVIALADTPERDANIEASGVDVLIIDPFEGEGGGLAVLDRIAPALRPGGPRIVVVTAQADIETAVNAMQRGAADFVMRPLNGDRLRLAVQRALEQRHLGANQARVHRDLLLNDVGQRLLEMLDAEPLCAAGIEALMRYGTADAAVFLGPEGVLAARGVDAGIFQTDAFSAPVQEVLTLVPDRIDARLIGFAHAHVVGIGEGRSVLLLYRKTAPNRRAVEDVQFLARHFSAAVRNLVRYERAQRRARHDHLTGLFNARALTEALHQHLVAASEARSPVSVVFIDVDHFKSVNDRLGHLQGSALLVEFTQILTRALRRGGPFAARFGGDEFVVVLPELNHDAAMGVAERLRTVIATHRFLQREGHAVALTVSLGVATFPDHATEAQKLLDHADRALYVAKDAGRNATRSVQDVFAGPAS